MVGTWMQTTAAAWLVWNLSHSAAALGFVTLLGLSPFLFLAPWTGVWADRIDRKRVLLITQAAAMLLAFTLAILVQTDSSGSGTSISW
jgi:MFS family permease